MIIRLAKNIVCNQNLKSAGCALRTCVITTLVMITIRWRKLEKVGHYLSALLSASETNDHFAKWLPKTTLEKMSFCADS